MLTSHLYRGKIAFQDEIYAGEHQRIVPEDLFQEVQSTLAAQGPGEAARKKRPSTSILKGLVFDEAGNRLQTTHANKKGRKYRYYVSATKIRDVNKDPNGFRVPASDLEKIVVQSLAGRLRDKIWLQSALSDHIELIHLQRLTDASSHFANEVERQLTENTGLTQNIVERIVVEKKSITIRIQPTRLAALLLGQEMGTAGQTSVDNGQIGQPIEIKVSGQFIRCGKEVRLVIGNDDSNGASVNDRLLREIIQARRWFDDLANGRAASITELARSSGISAPYISKKISLAFLSPDITEMIVSGTQPIGLTPEAIKRACPLPMSWDEQRAALLP